MTEPADFTVNQISEAADHIIAELQDDPNSVITLPIPNGLSARERADLFDHHDALVSELRRRDLKVVAHVRYTITGAVLAIDLRP
jgi:hypothetical protein